MGAAMSDEASGWVTVPRVPTAEMLEAALCGYAHHDGYPPPEQAYAAMLEAAPTPGGTDMLARIITGQDRPRYTGTVGGLHLFEVASIPNDDTTTTGQDRPNTEGQTMELTDRVIEVGDTVEVHGVGGERWDGLRCVVAEVEDDGWIIVSTGKSRIRFGPQHLRLIAKATPITTNPGRAEPIYGAVSDEDKRPENLTSDTHSRGGPVTDIGLLWSEIESLRQSDRDRQSEIKRLVGIAEALVLKDTKPEPSVLDWSASRPQITDEQITDDELRVILLARAGAYRAQPWCEAHREGEGDWGTATPPVRERWVGYYVTHLLNPLTRP